MERDLLCIFMELSYCLQSIRSHGLLHRLQVTKLKVSLNHLSLTGLIFRSFGKIAKSDYWFCYVCPSVCQPFRLDQLGSQWTNFHEILYL